ncbi:MAG: hypothetical protein LBE91_14885 [Tannerella sp.]|jgi:hypothetical protein|nr:hypothetical protein [Tannerella sp.]
MELNKNSNSAMEIEENSNRMNLKNLMSSGIAKTILKNKKLLFLFISITISFSCNKENGDNNTEPIEPYGEQGLVLIEKIAEECERYVNTYLDQYLTQSNNVNINDLIHKIKVIEEVDEVSTNDDNSVIRIRLKNGACFNHLIFRADDERLMTEDIENIYQQLLDENNQLKNVELNSAESNYTAPTVRKALILAPYHYNNLEHDFSFLPPDRLNNLTVYLKSVGYDVVPFINNGVTIDRLRGDYLKQFGVIYIATHGGQSFQSLSGKNTSMFFLATSIVFNGNISSYDDIDNLALGKIDGKLRLFVSEKWISKNLNSLPNSLVYIDACWSAKGELKNLFLGNGAGVYVGWINKYPIPIANEIVINVFYKLSKGMEFDEVYSGPLWSLITPAYSFDVGGYFHYKRDPNTPFYLTKEEEDEEEDSEIQFKDTYFANTKWNINLVGNAVGNELIKTVWSINGPFDQKRMIEFTQNSMLFTDNYDIDHPYDILYLIAPLNQKITIVNKGEIIVSFTRDVSTWYQPEDQTYYLSDILSSYEYTFKMESANSQFLSGLLNGYTSWNEVGDYHMYASFNGTCTGTRIR